MHARTYQSLSKLQPMHTKAPVVLNSTASHHAPALDKTWSCWMDQEQLWMLEFEIATSHGRRIQLGEEFSRISDR
jgi:putative SOS response-associated peptidase YedK